MKIESERVKSIRVLAKPVEAGRHVAGFCKQPAFRLRCPGWKRCAPRSPRPPCKWPTRRRGGCSPSATIWASWAGHSFPRRAGASTALSPYLELLQEHRGDFTVFSGVSHPNVDGGHPSDISFLTAAPHPASSSFRNSISLDQFVAERIGVLTRFPSITLAVNTNSRSLSWTGTGVAIPPEDRASAVFNQLFLQGSEEEIQSQILRPRHGPQHSRRGLRPGPRPGAQRQRPRQGPARPVLHQRPRPRAPAAAIARLGDEAQAGGEHSLRQSIRRVRPNTWKKSRRCTTWRSWRSKPILRGRSR